MKKEITIFTDGACSGNPGKGGWGAVLLYKDNEKYDKAIKTFEHTKYFEFSKKQNI